jgi:hypothetical protein
MTGCPTWHVKKSLSPDLKPGTKADPGRLQKSAAPVYKTEPHASADAV